MVRVTLHELNQFGESVLSCVAMQRVAGGDPGQNDIVLEQGLKWVVVEGRLEEGVCTHAGLRNSGLAGDVQELEVARS
jgi:hypothetical protein